MCSELNGWIKISISYDQDLVNCKHAQNSLESPFFWHVKNYLIIPFDEILSVKSFFPRYSGILSAYGMALADVVQEAQEPCAAIYGSGQEITVHVLIVQK